MARVSFGLLFLVALGCRKDWDAQDLDGDGYTAADGDCNPGDPGVSPDATELCDGRDNDCDTEIDEGVGTPWLTDADGDGFGDDATAVTSCFPPPATVTLGGDCDDADAAAHPGAAEACDGSADTNCDGSTPGEDADEDGVVACLDCDDGDADVFPGAEETCDGADEDCDGAIDEDATDAADAYVDLDGDGYGSDRIVVTGCEAPEGFVDAADDCDDLAASSFPNAPELCDGADNDCNGTIDDGATGTSTYWLDADKDGYGDPNSEVDACARPSGYADNYDDCDDADAAYNPGATESCSDPNDYNCDGSVGQADGDGDGTQACSDCDDGDPAVEPGAPEICDGVDNDCNGQIDETAPTWYADVDGDGHGGTQLTAVSCDAPGGFVASSDDCDDLRAEVSPSATEACDGADTDCVGGPDADEADADGDRWRACEGDCDDSDPTAFPNATLAWADGDGDGYGAGAPTAVCEVGTGQAGRAGDCDDALPTSFPGAPEACNTQDDDCDGAVDETGATGGSAWYLDADGDGVGGSKVSVTACSAPAGYLATNTDCDDAESLTFPGATEQCDGRDNNCDKASLAGEADADKDNWRACGGDCNDADKAINPTATELCNSKDDDCDGATDDAPADATTWYADADADGWGVASATKAQCTAPTGYTAMAGDCNDTNAAISPSDDELCATAADDDCDGSANEADARDTTPWFQDADNDKHGTPTNFTLACTAPTGRVSLADDCNDANAAIYGGASETWYDGVDGNCDGKSDFDQDGDGYTAMKYGGTDCDDTNASVAVCSGATQASAGRTCNTIKAAAPASVSGVFWIDPDNDGNTSDAFQTYCDMTRDGGGWTLVLQNNWAVASTSNPNWAQSTASGALVRGGTLGSNLAGFDYLMALAEWNQVGSTARMEVGSTVNVPLRQATYTVTIGSSATNYALTLTNQSITIGGVSPGIYTYHNSRAWTTLDRDNDGYAGNCAVYYGNPWWYNSCWDGSFWGTADTATGHQTAPYWTSSGGDYYNWGAIWIR